MRSAIAVAMFLLATATGEGLVDLHVHSRFSDGSDTAVELVQKAHDAGIRVLAITDHDQVA